MRSQTPGEELDDFDEAVDGVPVLADVRAVEPAPSGALPAVQAAAVAATSFVAGAATVALVRRRGARRSSRRALSKAARAETYEVVASRRFMVDIHLLDKR